MNCYELLYAIDMAFHIILYYKLIKILYIYTHLLLSLFRFLIECIVHIYTPFYTTSTAFLRLKYFTLFVSVF